VSHHSIFLRCDVVLSLSQCSFCLHRFWRCSLFFMSHRNALSLALGRGALCFSYLVVTLSLWLWDRDLCFLRHGALAFTSLRFFFCVAAIFLLCRCGLSFVHGGLSFLHRDAHAFALRHCIVFCIGVPWCAVFALHHITTFFLFAVRCFFWQHGALFLIASFAAQHFG